MSVLHACLRRVGSLLVISGLALVMGVAWSSTATAASCTPRAITGSELTDFSVTSQSGKDPVKAWDMVRAALTLELEDGHCAGDQITVTVPKQLDMSRFTSGELRDEHGAVVGTTTITGNDVTVTLTDFVESHTGVRLQAWWLVQIDSTITPGSTEELEWSADGRVVRTPLPVAECPDCEAQHTWASKWGHVGEGDVVHVTIELPVATEDDQRYTFTDMLTSEGQQMVCPQTPRVNAFTSRDRWGTPQAPFRDDAVTVTGCTPTSLSGEVVLQRGEEGRVEIAVQAQPGSAGPWTDRATVETLGRSDSTEAEIRRQDSGGDATGTASTSTTTTPPTSTSTTTPPATTSTTTSPATTSTPPTSTSTTTSPASTSTTTPPASTSTTSPPPSPSTTTTVTSSTSEAPPATTSGSPSTPAVVQTDAVQARPDGPSPAVLAGAVALLLCGGGLMLRSRQTDRRH